MSTGVNRFVPSAFQRGTRALLLWAAALQRIDDISTSGTSSRRPYRPALPPPNPVANSPRTGCAKARKPTARRSNPSQAALKNARDLWHEGEDA